MALETASYINQLVASNPPGADRVHQGDDHIRLLKSVLKNTFPNLTGAVTQTQDQLNNPFVMPIGAIVTWYGSSASVPAGWGLCNGGTYTRTDGEGEITAPDLRDRCVIGAGTIAGQGLPAGAVTSAVNTGAAGDHTHTVSGGAHTHSGSATGHALTEAELPAHRHLLAKNGVSNLTPTASLSLSQERTAGGDTEYVLMGANGEPDVLRSAATGSGTPHTHDLSLDSTAHSHTVGNSGAHQHSVTVSTIQPVLGLHFIMKI